MNNRYTFKAKRKDGQWVYGNLLEPKRMHSFNGIDRSDKFCLIVESSFANGGRVCVGKKHWVLRETLCQCTGLQDIDGKDIFENDIVYVEGGESYYGKYEVQGNCEIRYLGNHFEIVVLENDCELGWGFADYLSTIQVIGNKFDKEED